MKLLLFTASQVILMWLLFWLFPAWWWIMFLPFFFCLFFTSELSLAFFSSTFAGLVVWGGKTLFSFAYGGSLIAGKMADLFGIHSTPIFLIVLIVFGGFVAGLSGLTGTALRTFFIPPKPKSIYY